MVAILRSIFENAHLNRIPISVTMEITEVCNFRCMHCYLGNVKRVNYLSLEQAKSFIDQITALGCMYLTLTGGEAMLHPYFKEIYMYATSKACIVTVFSNGSYLNDSLMNLFNRYPPRRIEITLYGFSNKTYDIVANAKNQFDIVLNNISHFLAHNINILLKMFVVKENLYELDAAYHFAIKNKVPFKFDYMIIDNLASKKLLHQISSEDIEYITNKYPNKVDSDYEWGNFLDDNYSNQLFNCGAGRTTCWLKADNQLLMCNFLDNIKANLNNVSVAEAWHYFGTFLDEKLSQYSECFNCKYREYCSNCPGKSYAFTGDHTMKVINRQLCEVARITERMANIN